MFLFLGRRADPAGPLGLLVEVPAQPFLRDVGARADQPRDQQDRYEEDTEPADYGEDLGHELGERQETQPEPDQRDRDEHEPPPPGMPM